MNNENTAINYIEFRASDMAATKTFYSQAFGWSFVDYGPEYASFLGAGIDGGFTLSAQPTVNGGVLVVLYHKDLEKIAHRIAQLGCEIVKPIFAFPGGHRFHFIDPNGNELAIWSE